jgi:regulation of enolase protein 1 (concanavalin A-like superfamily)
LLSRVIHDTIDGRPLRVATRPVSTSWQALLPPLSWQGAPAAVGYTDDALRITAAAKTDWFCDPRTAIRRFDAAALTCEAIGNVLLSARVAVEFVSDFDAGALVVWKSDSCWAKLCLEYSAQHEPMIVSVVTRDSSDDCNSVVVGAGNVYLRIATMGTAFAFHYSTDGRFWHFVRVFGLGAADTPTRIGFLAQSPVGDGCTATFDDIHLTHTLLSDTRNGS